MPHFGQDIRRLPGPSLDGHSHTAQSHQALPRDLGKEGDTPKREQTFRFMMRNINLYVPIRALHKGGLSLEQIQKYYPGPSSTYPVIEVYNLRLNKLERGEEDALIKALHSLKASDIFVFNSSADKLQIAMKSDLGDDGSDGPREFLLFMVKQNLPLTFTG